MRICVLQSSYDGVNTPIEGIDPSQDPSLFGSSHEFHNHWIQKATANEQIDEAIDRGFDLYFNFLWGQREDVVAGIDAVKHLESRGVPFIGMPSRILERSKLDFYADAERAGLVVPRSGSSHFPVFVKPARGCASMLIDEKSLCRDQDELDAQIALLDRKLAASQLVPTPTTSGCDIKTHKPLQNGNTNPLSHGHIVVQEYVEGQDYSCVIVEMNDTPIALTPTIYIYPPDELAKDQFLTFDLKHHPKTAVDVIERAKNPLLFDRLQICAIEAYKVNQMLGGGWGNVDLRVRAGNGEIVVLEVNPMPSIFTPKGDWEDIVIQKTFPGGHRALISVMIATKRFQMKVDEQRPVQVGVTYNKFAPRYHLIRVDLPLVMSHLISTYDYEGSLLDLGSGTGEWGQRLHEFRNTNHGMSPESKHGSVVGVDASAGMVQMSKLPEAYDKVHIGLMQHMVPSLPEFDHIVCFDCMHFLDPDTFNMVLSRVFQLARRSVTLSIAEVPDAYNAHLITEGYAHMNSINHLDEVVAFGVPNGWRLAYRKQHFAWKSLHTNDDVQATVFRFEATQQPGAPRGG